MRFLVSIVLAGCAGFFARDDVVREVFKVGDFLPHVLTEEQLIASYGAGEQSYYLGEVALTYLDKKCKTWLRASIQSDASPKYRIVQELTISSLPLSTRADSYPGDLCSLSLDGISLGESREEIPRARLMAARKESSILAGKEVTKITFNPIRDESDLYYSFYVLGNSIVGISIGVTE